MNSVKNNLKRFFDEVRDRKTEKAVLQIAQEGLAISATYVPVDMGVLINSEFRVLDYVSPEKVVASAGYSANYAVYVHEASGKLKGQPRSDGNGTYWSPDASPKFLERGFEELKPVIPELLRAIYAVK